MELDTYILYIIGVTYLVLIVIIIFLAYKLYSRKRNVYKILEDQQNDHRSNNESRLIIPNVLKLNTYYVENVGGLRAATSTNEIIPSCEQKTNTESEDQGVQKYRNAENMAKRKNPNIGAVISPSVIKDLCVEVLRKTTEKANKHNNEDDIEIIIEKYKNRNDPIKETAREEMIKQKKTFSFRRSASVSDIYDVVPNQHKPVKVKLTVDDTALLVSKRKSCIIVTDKITQYLMPIKYRSTYVNASSSNNVILSEIYK